MGLHDFTEPQLTRSPEHATLLLLLGAAAVSTLPGWLVLTRMITELVTSPNSDTMASSSSSVTCSKQHQPRLQKLHHALRHITISQGYTYQHYALCKVTSSSALSKCSCAKCLRCLTPSSCCL